MLEKITEPELAFVESIYNSVCFIECMFTDLENDNLADFKEDRFGDVRLAQLPLLSFEYMIDFEDRSLSTKANFKLREGSGNVYCFGGRKFGKSLCVEKLDLIADLVLVPGDNVGFASYDALHIEGILESIIQAFENHPFFKLFDPRIKRNPYFIYLRKNGSKVLGVNMNLAGENPGGQFYQKHFSRLYIEEASYETQEVYEKRLDSIGENGCVFRIAGMTNFTRHSPAGRIFYERMNKAWVVNLPQYCSPKWDEKEKERAIRERGGEDSVGYRVYVKGEVVEEGISAIDMERVRKNYDYKRSIKHFEINKEKLGFFEDYLVVERPKNAEYLYICADIGETASSEIIILSEVNRIFKYLYNITLYSLTDKEQFKIFDHLALKLEANYVGLDTTDGTGRSIYHSLEEKYPKENLVWVGFNEKIPVDTLKDEEGKMLLDKDGKPTYREEYVESWSIKRLKDILYEEGRINLPMDYKLDSQLNSVVSVQSGNRITFQCVAPEDHLLAAFRVFAITQWANEFVNTPKIVKKVFSKTGV